MVCLMLTFNKEDKTMADHNKYDKIQEVWEKTGTFELLKEKYLKEVEESFYFDVIHAEIESNKNDPSIEPLNHYEIEEFEDEEPIYCAYIGSVFSIYPSGKYYMPFAHSNVTAKEALLDEVYREALEEVLDKHGLFAVSGEGDPCDIFFCKSV